MFAGSSALVGVEMKRSADAYLKQFAKYLIAQVFEEVRNGAKDAHGLILLHQKPFDRAFTRGEDYVDMAELKEALIHYEFPDEARGVDLRPHHARLVELSETIVLGALSFGELSKRLERELESVPSDSRNSQTYARLIVGMLKELEMLR
jgi:hypothetical protein